MFIDFKLIVVNTNNCIIFVSSNNKEHLKIEKMAAATLYHGTTEVFQEFNTEVVFFTDNLGMAKSYGNVIVEKNININTNDCISVNANGENWRGFFLGDALAEQFYAKMVENDLVYYTMQELKKSRFSTNDVVSIAQDLGKKIVLINNVMDYGSEVESMKPSDVYVVLDKTILNNAA